MGANIYKYSVEELVDPLLKQFRDFYSNTNLRNTHLETPYIKVYVRKSRRLHDGGEVNCVDIASIAILNSINRGRGVFTMFLGRLLKEYPSQSFYVESIVNPIIMIVTGKFGFVTTPHSHPLCPDQILVRKEYDFK